MKPDEQNQNRRVGTPLIPQRPLLSSQTPPVRGAPASNSAAAEIVRGQLSSIYDGNTSTPTPQTTPVAQPENQTTPVQQSLETANPYERTHAAHADIQAEQWKQYHSAWQEYYQKYYERYYIGQVHQARQALEAKVNESQPALRQPAPTAAKEAPAEPEALTRDEAMYDLRAKLLGNLQTSAKKVRGSRHFIPITAALAVMLVFLFLQYNRVLFANVEAYISPGNIDPANLIIDPTASVAVGDDPKLIIPKINVDVPVNYNTTPDYDSQMKAMENGVAWFGIAGANSHPGQVGNTVLSGHSSNDVIDSGDYKFIFARLEHLSKGDTIYVNYKGTRYTYTVTKKEVVKPTNVQALVYDTDKPILTLITCTPLGTSLNRLLVTAEQVSPDPAEASKAPASSGNSEPASIPGNSPTFLQRVFGGGN